MGKGARGGSLALISASRRYDAWPPGAPLSVVGGYRLDEYAPAGRRPGVSERLGQAKNHAVGFPPFPPGPGAVFDGSFPNVRLHRRSQGTLVPARPPNNGSIPSAATRT